MRRAASLPGLATGPVIGAAAGAFGITRLPTSRDASSGLLRAGRRRRFRVITRPEAARRLDASSTNSRSSTATCRRPRVSSRPKGSSRTMPPPARRMAHPRRAPCRRVRSRLRLRDHRHDDRAACIGPILVESAPEGLHRVPAVVSTHLVDGRAGATPGPADPCRVFRRRERRPDAHAVAAARRCAVIKCVPSTSSPPG